jgi:hypothetical protein
MWWGLIGPSNDHWIAGARALTTAPLTIVAQSATPSSELEVDDVARVRLYANRAMTTSDPDARVDLYGTLLTTCAHCHAVLRDRPRRGAAWGGTEARVAPGIRETRRSRDGHERCTTIQS